MNINLKQLFNRHASRCPGCGRRIDAENHFCYHCCHLLSDNNSHLLPVESVTGADLQRILLLNDKETNVHHATLRYKLSEVLFCLGIICLFACLISFFININFFLYSFVGIFVLFGLSKVMMPFGTAHMLTEKQQARLVENYLIPQEINAIFGDTVSFEPKEKLPKSLIESYRFYSHSFDKYKGSQLLTGTYRGIPIKMGRVNLKYTIRKDDSTRTYPLFDGYCLYAETPLRPTTQFLLQEKDFGVVYQAGINPEAETFNDSIYLHASNRKAAYAMLTPTLQEKLLNLRNKNCRFCLILPTNGRLFIAVQDRPSLTLTSSYLSETKHAIRTSYAHPVQLLDILLSECPR